MKKFGLNKPDTALYRIVQNVFDNRLGVTHVCETDRQTDSIIA